MNLKDELFEQKQVSVDVLRLDEIHPVVSGNKLFKLHYFLEEALSSHHKTILSYGGAWSNHLLATAYAGKTAGLRTIGVVRGERPPSLSHTLQQCMEYDMQLKFISREAYGAREDPSFRISLQNEFGAFLNIPEGGYHPLGARGAAKIMDLVTGETPSHICTAMGTATTLAGLLMAAKGQQKIIGVNVLKGDPDTAERIGYLLPGYANMNNLELLTEYHFGGYAKKNDSLVGFMNQCWKDFALPLDFIYTGKMLYAVFEEIKKGRFPAGSRVLCLHTGGLQGNKSLPAGSLLY